MKLAWSNAKNMREANYVVFGVPDESASRSQRKGSSMAPYAIRFASQRSVFYRQGRESVAFPSGFDKKVFLTFHPYIFSSQNIKISLKEGG